MDIQIIFHFSPLQSMMWLYINHGIHVNRSIAQVGGNSTTGIYIFNFDTSCQNICKKTAPIYILTNNK